jgi:hypothetical protein
MNFIPRPITQHYRARLIAWTLAMLMWTLNMLVAGGVLSARHERQRAWAMSLAWLTRRVKLLIISRASVLARKRTRPLRLHYRGRVLRTRGFVNAVIGARVRRMLKRKGVVETIVALIDVLRAIDTYAAPVAKRLRRGLSRRMLHLFALPPAPDAPVATLFVSGPRFADSS